MRTRNRKKSVIQIILLTLGLMTFIPFVRWHGFPLWEWWREWRSGILVHELGTQNKVIALTFDDGPDPICTPPILDILHNEGVHATFFIPGRMLVRCPEIARREMAEGHTLGNHTFSHPYLERKASGEVQKEILSCDEVMDSLLHLKTTLFRPPRGNWNPIITEEARREGKQIILWSGAVEHSEASSPQQLIDRALRLAHPGAILLLHDGAYGLRINTVKALPGIIHGLKARGYRFVTIPIHKPYL